ncbi:helix-turn-helix domain-containing protein [Algoriphagus resistens]|uniref:helix-turn-helix domain-containing protein n=1 Tax=Algoriphagus resistens TaxID=1750590 RepID=UPI000716C36A|nr:AraC family transcriptional regulator [Algoriphagus resistens]
MLNHLITYKSNRIVLSHERKKRTVLDIYPDHHLLTHVKEGILILKQGSKEYCFTKGDFVLLKKYAQVTITKTWDGEGTKFSSIVFSFHEDLVQQAVSQLDIQVETKSHQQLENIIAIKPNPVLNQFIQSLNLFFDEGQKMDGHLAKLKTLEALIGIIQTHPELLPQLRTFSEKNKADLHHYMKYNFLKNKKLKEFASESGRSLSVFKKDFESIYKTSPAKWLKQKRLEHAYKLLTATNRKPMDIYLECGFEDLAHFSRSFKRQFQINPSQIKTLQTSR